MGKKNTQSTEKYSFIFRNHPDGILIFQENQILYGNPMALKLFSCSDLEELKQKSPFERITQLKPVFGGKASWEEWVTKSSNEESLMIEVHCDYFRQQAYYTHWTFTKLTENNPPLFMLTIHPVKAQKKETEQISSHRLDALANASPDVIMEFDRHLRHVFCSHSVEHYWKRPAHEFLHKTYGELGFNPDLTDLLEKAICQVFTTKESRRLEFQTNHHVYLDLYLVPNFEPGNDKVQSVFGFARDITPLKKAEEKLKVSQNKLSLALDIAGLAVWEYYPDTNAFRVSRRQADLYGLKFDKLPRLLKAEVFVNNFVMEDDRKSFLDAFHVLKNKRYNKPFSNEFRIMIEGEVRYFITLGQSIDKKNKKGYYYCGAVQDITQYKKKEQELKQYRTRLEALVDARTRALKESESRLQDAMDMAKLGTWEYDLKTGRFYASRSVFESLHILPDKEGGNFISVENYIKHIHPLDLPKVKALSEKVAYSYDDSFLKHLEYRVIGRDKKIRTIYFSTKIILDKQRKHKEKIYGVIQDVTDIRKVELEKERLFALAEHTPDIILISDKNYEIIYANDSAIRFFGEDLFDRGVSANSSTSSNAISIYSKEALEEALKRGVWSGENNFTDQKGKEVPVSQVIIAMFHADGTLESISTIIRDISRQKTIEQDLRFKKQELDTFIYRASHDLRGPVATLQGLNQVAMVDLKGQDNALQFFKMYTKEVEKLHHILISLIDITRIKDLELQHLPIDFNALIEQSLGALKTYPGFSEVNFDISIELNKTYYSDPKLLKTVFHSILQNAIDYRRRDGKGQVSLQVHEAKTEPEVIIEIKDNGKGVSPAIQHKVFDMFYRGSEASEGPGLGLYMVKNIVDRLKGKVYLKSELNKGASFKIVLPF